MTARCLRLSMRSPETLVTALVLPVLLMLVFVYLFGGAIETGVDYVTYVVPGVLLLCIGFGSASTAASVSHDMTSGAIDRFRALDVNGASFLAGHVHASVARNALSTALVLVVACTIGFRPDPGVGGWVAALATLAAFTLALSWVAAVIGLAAGSPEAAGGYTFALLFLPYPSSAFVPIETMPGWLQGFATNQPVTPVIETVRGALLGTPTGNEPALALAWCAGLLAASMLAARILFARRT
ncbi:MAG: ABC transporter permease [Actinomycetota bacterium]|nr:ABC transporter permease [Actinomycetota bacterium]